MCWQVIDLTECFVCMPNITLVTMKVYVIKKTFSPPPPHTGLHSIWATGLLLYTSGKKVEMEDFWAGAFWALMIWLYLIIGLIMIPAMFGFSLGISETYMTILVKTLEVLLFYCYALGRYCQLLVHDCLLHVLLFCSGPRWRCRRQTQTSEHLKPLYLMVSRKLCVCKNVQDIYSRY